MSLILWLWIVDTDTPSAVKSSMQTRQSDFVLAHGAFHRQANSCSELQGI